MRTEVSPVRLLRLININQMSHSVVIGCRPLSFQDNLQNIINYSVNDRGNRVLRELDFNMINCCQVASYTFYLY